MKRTGLFPAFSGLLLLALAWGCGGEGPAWQGTLVDSAGVAIVQNPATPLWTADEAWTVTEELRIGTVAGQPEFQFGLVSGMTADRQGNIYVMDLQAQQARVFDPAGNFLRTIGAPGSGPGELSQQAGFIFVDMDGSVVIPDLGNQRVNRYAPGGDPLGSFPIQLQSGVPVRFLLSEDGRFLAQLRGLNVPGMAALAEGDPIVEYDSTGAVVDTVAILPKGQTLSEITQEQARIKIFAPEPVWDLASDGTIYYGMNDQYRILVNRPDGTLARIITREAEQKPVEEADRNAILGLLREQYQQFGIPPAQIEQIMSGIYFADFYPMFGQLFVGPGETLWVQRIRSARDMAAGAEEAPEFDPQNIGSPEWEVFDVEGRYLGVVTLPDRFTPFESKGDLLYGVWRDELDVQYVMRLRVNRATR